MQTQKRNRLLAVGGAVVAVAVGGWLAAGYVATRHAESVIHDTLVKYGMRDGVSWRSLSATPFGTVTMRDVVLGESSDPKRFLVDQVVLSDLENEPGLQRGKAELRGVANASGTSPLAAFDLIRSGGAITLPAFDSDVSWHVSAATGEGNVKVSVDQPEALVGRAELDVTGLRTLLESAQSMQGGEALAGLNAMSMLGMASSIALKQGRIEIRDQGHVARSVALHKRYAYMLDPNGAAPAKQRDEGFALVTSHHATNCREDLGRFGAAASCDPVMAFVHGRERTLVLQAAPDQPIEIAPAVMQAMMGSPQAVFRRLKLSAGH